MLFRGRIGISLDIEGIRGVMLNILVILRKLHVILHYTIYNIDFALKITNTFRKHSPFAQPMQIVAFKMHFHSHMYRIDLFRAKKPSKFLFLNLFEVGREHLHTPAQASTLRRRYDNERCFKMAARANMSDYEINSQNNDIEPQQDGMSKSSEEPLGNVSDYVAEPIGFNGERRKGILIFDANFESGNLGRVDLINEFEYDLFVRPDTCNARLFYVLSLLYWA